MVAASAPMVLHAQEGDRKRKQTLERAKAHHLCRQLQMRLQYARLKVEHGWQKQSLNEVENLYFHHSHQRGPKPFQSSLIATTTQPEQTNFIPPSNPQSSLSFISRTSGTIAPDNVPSGLNNRGIKSCADAAKSGSLSSPSTPLHAQESSALLPSSSTTPTPMAIDKTPPGSGPAMSRYSTLPTPTSPQRPPPAPLRSALQSPVQIRSSPRPQPSYAAFASSSSSTSRHPENSPLLEPSPPLPPILVPPPSPSKTRSRATKSHLAKSTPSRSNHTTTHKNGNSTTPTAIAISSSSLPTAAMSTTPSTSTSSYVPTKDPFNFGPVQTTGLTYDAFWSSHAAVSPRTLNHLRTALATSTPAASGSAAASGTTGSGMS